MLCDKVQPCPTSRTRLRDHVCTMSNIYMYVSCSVRKPSSYSGACSSVEQENLSQARAGQGGFVERHGILLDMPQLL
jgi:hypothetical protein